MQKKRYIGLRLSKFKYLNKKLFSSTTLKFTKQSDLMTKINEMLDKSKAFGTTARHDIDIIAIKNQLKELRELE
jgi:hypothetical protein